MCRCYSMRRDVVFRFVHRHRKSRSFSLRRNTVSTYDSRKEGSLGKALCDDNGVMEARGNNLWRKVYFSRSDWRDARENEQDGYFL